MSEPRSLRILLTVHQFFPEYFSGTEVLTFSVAKELKRRGHEVLILTGFPARTHMPDEERFDEYEIEGMRVFRFHHAYVQMGGQSAVTEVEYDNHLTARYFSRLVRDVAPDVIHFFHLSRLGGGLIDVAVGARIPAFYTPTDFWSICPTSQLLLRDGKTCGGPSKFGGNCIKHVAELTRGPAVQRASRLIPTFAVDAAAGLTAKGFTPRYPMSGEIAAMAHRRPFLVERLNLLNKIISPTKLMTRVLTSNGVATSLIVDSAYGIDLATQDAAPLSQQRINMITVGFIGTLAQHKGCHILIDAFKKLDPTRVRLKIYGNPSDFPAYFETLKAKSDSVPNIEFCGTFPNGQVANIMQGIDVLVVPSLWFENTPLVVYSSLAAKRPVIASNFAGLVEAVNDGQNGLTFEPGNVEHLQACLQRLLTDESLLPTLSANCKRPKSSAEYVDELLNLYATPVEPRPEYSAKVRTFEPLEDTRNCGWISGWLVANHQPPKRIRAVESEKVLGEVTQFLPRPDVRDGLAASGLKLKSPLCGFAIKMSGAFRRDDVKFLIEMHNSHVVELPLSRVAMGTSVNFGDGCFVGLDSERQPATKH